MPGQNATPAPASPVEGALSDVQAIARARQESLLGAALLGPAMVYYALKSKGPGFARNIVLAGGVWTILANLDKYGKISDQMRAAL